MIRTLTLLAQADPEATPATSTGALVRELLTTSAPSPAQVAILALFLLGVLALVVGVELFRRRRDQLSRNRSRWENFASMARRLGLDDEAIERMREMHQGLDALHAPEAMLRIPAVYDRALDAWIEARQGSISPKEWESLEKVRLGLKFRGLGAETSLSHTRQIAQEQELRVASEDGHWTATAVLTENKEDRMVLRLSDSLPPSSARIRIAFSRQGDGEYKAMANVLGFDPETLRATCAHTEQVVRQQLRMWVRVPVLIPGRMRRVIGPSGTPHPEAEFEVTLLDLSGGGAMVSATHEVEVESRGLLDFNLGEGLLEGVRFVMLRIGKPSRPGGHVCHLCFENIDVQTQERIMRYVFERQRSGRMGG